MNIIKYNKIWFTISLIFIMPGMLAILTWGLKLGIDFTGGSLIEISGTENSTKVEEIVKENGIESPVIKKTGDTTLLIRTKELSEDKHREVVGILRKELKVEEIRFETVGPTVSADITQKSFYLIAIASFFIVIFLAYSFRKVPKPVNSWQFGICAIIALIHDILVMLGIFAILGHFAGIEIDSMFVVAILTVIGFSVHDTIVVFDRVRENLIKEGSGDIEYIANKSIIDTFSRSINTSFSTLIVLLTLYLIGGETTKIFILALIIGILSGIYSSIFTATPILVIWQRWKEKRT